MLEFLCGTDDLDAVNAMMRQSALWRGRTAQDVSQHFQQDLSAVSLQQQHAPALLSLRRHGKTHASAAQSRAGNFLWEMCPGTLLGCKT